MIPVPLGLESDPDCALADGLRLIAARRGLRFLHLHRPEANGTDPQLIDAEDPASASRGPAEILARIRRGERIAPRDTVSPALLALLQAATEGLSALEIDGFPATLDLQIHALRHALRALPGQLPPGAGEGTNLSDPLLLLAPLLWRLRLVDRWCGLHLLTGLGAVETLAEALRTRQELAAILDTGAEARHHATLRARAGTAGLAAARNDWSRALGPEGRERTLPMQLKRLDGSRTAGA